MVKHPEGAFSYTSEGHAVEGAALLAHDPRSLRDLLKIIPEHPGAQSDRDRGKALHRDVKRALKHRGIDVVAEGHGYPENIGPVFSSCRGIYFSRVVELEPAQIFFHTDSLLSLSGNSEFFFDEPADIVHVIVRFVKPVDNIGVPHSRSYYMPAFTARKLQI